MNPSLLQEATELQRQMHEARNRYLHLNARAVQKRNQFLQDQQDDETSARLHKELRAAERESQQAHQTVGELETAARNLYRKWLIGLQPGDLVLTHSSGGWIEVKVKLVKKSSIKLANGASFSNLTGVAWRGRTFLRMPAAEIE